MIKSTLPSERAGKYALTTRETAAWVHFAEGTLANWRTRGEGPPFIRVGRGRVLYLIEDVEDWLSERRRAA